MAVDYESILEEKLSKQITKDMREKANFIMVGLKEYFNDFMSLEDADPAFIHEVYTQWMHKIIDEMIPGELNGELPYLPNDLFTETNINDTGNPLNTAHVIQLVEDKKTEYVGKIVGEAISYGETKKDKKDKKDKKIK